VGRYTILNQPVNLTINTNPNPNPSHTADTNSNRNPNTKPKFNPDPKRIWCGELLPF